MGNWVVFRNYGFVFFICFFLQSKAFGQESAFQRLAFGAIDLTMEAGAESEMVASNCYDEFRHAPENLSGYKSVQFDGQSSVIIGNSAPISLEQALASGALVIAGSGFQGFHFVNKSGQRMAVKTNTSTLIGDTPNDKAEISSELLKIVNSPVSYSWYATKTKQDILWEKRARQQAYLREGLLKEGFGAEDLNIAEQKFKEKYHLKSDGDLQTLINKKILFFEYKKINTPVLSYLKLLNADNTSDDIYLKALQTFKDQRHIATEGMVQYEMNIEAELLRQKIYVLKNKEGLSDKSDNDQIWAKEANYKSSRNLTTDVEYVFNIKKDYSTLKTELAEAESLIILVRSQSRSTTIKTFQQAAGLPETGELDTAPTVSLLASYYSLLNLFHENLEFKDVTDVIRACAAVKEKLRLSPDFKLDERSKNYIEKLLGIFSNNRAFGYGVKTRITENKLIAIGNSYPETVGVFNINDLSITTTFTLGGALVDKIDNELFLVHGNICTVGELTDAVSALPDYLKTNFSFGERMTKEDCIGVVRTQQIRELTITPGDNRIASITANNYDFSTPPHIKASQGLFSGLELNFAIKKKNKLSQGSGIVGDIAVDVVGVPARLLTKARLMINNLYLRMRTRPNLDFASGLRADLKANRIEADEILLTMSNIEISKISNRYTFKYYANTIDRRKHKSNSSKKLFGRMLLPFDKRRFFSNV